MKIVHVCLNCFYIEGWEYQENVLPRKHKQLGYDVSIIASTYSFSGSGEREEREVGDYYNTDGIPVKILPYKGLHQRIKQFGLFVGLKKALGEISPDIIFLHGAHFLSVFNVIAYKKLHPDVKIFADQHGDYVNTPLGTWKQKLNRRVIWRLVTFCIAPHIIKFWGVTPMRVDYLMNVYKLPASKVDLLVMGGDESKIDLEHQLDIHNHLREKHQIQIDDFLLITGGKIDKHKNTHLLMEAVSSLGNPNVKLVVFGQPDDKMRSTIECLSQNISIRNIGWIKSDKVYDWFLASDLAIFPGTHSVLWEQAVACGIPCVFKHWEGMEHVDVGGNCQFLYKDSAEEIEATLTEIINDKGKYQAMKRVATEKGIKEFSYLEIAKKAISVQ